MRQSPVPGKPRACSGEWFGSGCRVGWVLWPSSSPTLQGSGEQRFDDLVAENDERCHGSSPLGNGFVSCGLAYAGDDLFSAKLFQIVGSTTWPVLGFVLATDSSDLFG